MSDEHDHYQEALDNDWDDEDCQHCHGAGVVDEMGLGDDMPCPFCQA